MTRIDYLTVLVIIIDLIFITYQIFRLKSRLKSLEEEINSRNKEVNKNNSFKRNHSLINPVSFNSPIQARKKLYKEYENEKGLYEPVTPKKGIKIREG